MKKPITECSDLRDFLSANYPLKCLKVFADDCEAFVTLPNGMFMGNQVYELFKGEIEEHWKDYEFEYIDNSFYSFRAQQTMSAIQSMAEKICFEEKNPPCQADFKSQPCTCEQCKKETE